MKLALVTWHDAWSSADAYDEKQHGPQVIRSVGFIVKRDRAGISLAACADDEGGFERPLFIPAGIIKRVEILRR